MNAADHLAKAESFARLADDLYYRSAVRCEPSVDTLLRRAEVLAQLGRLHLDLHRELVLMEHFPDPAPALGVAAPVVDLPMRPDTRKAKPWRCPCPCDVRLTFDEHGLAFEPDGRPHDCRPPSARKAPADATRQGPDQHHPRED
jgi:hypothetical protein